MGAQPPNPSCPAILTGACHTPTLPIYRLVCHGAGRGRIGDRPLKPHSLAPRGDFEPAYTLGCVFGQNAIISVGADGIASVELLANGDEMARA